MAKRDSKELEAILARMKDHERQLKEELAQQRKNEEKKAQRERARQLIRLGEIAVGLLGEQILSDPEEFENQMRRSMPADTPDIQEEDVPLQDVTDPFSGTIF